MFLINMSCVLYVTGECSVTGDMYFQSFDGRVYTFPATCQYVLAKSQSPGGFIVTIQNTPCGPVSALMLSYFYHFMLINHFTN